MKFLSKLVFGLSTIFCCDNIVVANPINIKNSNVVQSSNNSADTGNMSYDEIMQSFVNVVTNPNNIPELISTITSNINNNNFVQAMVDFSKVYFKFLESNYQMNYFIESFIENNDKNNEYTNALKYLNNKDDVTDDLFAGKIDIAKSVDIDMLQDEGINISANNQNNIFNIIDELCNTYLKEAFEQKDINKIEKIRIFIDVNLSNRKDEATSILEKIKNMSQDDKDILKEKLLGSNFKDLMKYINIEINGGQYLTQNIIGNIQDNTIIDIAKNEVEYLKIEREYLQELGIDISTIE